jgi:photoactive yellow protein
MPDPARDLYSFLRSKDFISEEDGSSSSEERSSSDDSSEDPPRLRAVEDYGDEDPSDANQEASTAEADVSSISFEDDDLASKAMHADKSTLDSADFGVIQVDDDGIVQFFNKYESELSGVDPSAAEGKNFFNELAPCSNNRLFRGRFKEGIRKGELKERFTYTYTYKMRPTLVEVRLCRSSDGRNWIFVQKQ